MPSNDTRLYRIQNSGQYFHAGVLKNSQQALMGLQLPELVLVAFTSEGDFLNCSVRKFTHALNRTSHGTWAFDDELFREELLRWQNQLGFSPCTISVKRFFLADRFIGIKDIPDHYQNVLDQPGDYDEDRRRELQEDIRRWCDDGMFVLYWNEEYYLNADGEVESS